VPRRGLPGLAGVRAHLSVPLFLTAYLLILSSAAQSGLGLVFWALGARLYSAHWVGDSTTVISVALLLSTVGQLGMSSLIVRYLPVAHSRSRHFVIVCYAAAVTVALLATAAAVASVSLWSPPLVFLRNDGWWLLLFVLSSVTGTIFQLEDSVMVGLHRTKWVPVENIAFAVSRVVLIVLLAHVLSDSGIVLASAIPSVLLPIVVNAAIFWRFLPSRLREAGERPAEWEVQDVRRLVFGNYVGSLAEMGSLYLLPVIVTNRLGASSEAYFYIPWQVMTGLTVLAANMSASLSVETAAGEELRRHVLSALKFVLGVLGSTAVVVGLVAHPLLLVFGTKYADSGAWALRWMLLATIPTGITMTGLAVARIHHNGRLIACTQLLGAVTLVLVSFLLLPDYGIDGAGVAALLSATLAMGVVAPTLWRALRS
jgi:O-antigen/teichoic acid export membrane protein